MDAPRGKRPFYNSGLRRGLLVVLLLVDLLALLVSRTSRQHVDPFRREFPRFDAAPSRRRFFRCLQSLQRFAPCSCPSRFPSPPRRSSPSPSRRRRPRASPSCSTSSATAASTI